MELIQIVSLIPASVLTRMLLNSTLLTPWGNYRKLVMDLYDKPGKNNSQCSVDLSVSLGFFCFSFVVVFVFPFFFPFFLSSPSPPPHPEMLFERHNNSCEKLKLKKSNCSQVAIHICTSGMDGTGPWMKLHLPTDKAETQSGDLLKTRQTEVQFS